MWTRARQTNLHRPTAAACVFWHASLEIKHSRWNWDSPIEPQTLSCTVSSSSAAAPVLTFVPKLLPVKTVLGVRPTTPASSRFNICHLLPNSTSASRRHSGTESAQWNQPGRPIKQNSRGGYREGSYSTTSRKPRQLRCPRKRRRYAGKRAATSGREDTPEPPRAEPLRGLSSGASADQEPRLTIYPSASSVGSDSRLRISGSEDVA